MSTSPSWPPDPAAFWQSWLRNLTMYAPLSGPVNQAIDASLVRSAGDQLGFININNAKTPDPALEQRITDEVASYGRQLGKVLDALDVLIRRQDRDGLPAADQHALDQLTELRTQVEAVKERAAAEDVDRLVAQVRTLRRDPERNADALRELREALGD